MVVQYEVPLEIEDIFKGKTTAEINYIITESLSKHTELENILALCLDIRLAQQFEPQQAKEIPVKREPVFIQPVKTEVAKKTVAVDIDDEDADVDEWFSK